MIRPSGCADMAKMAVSARSPKRGPLDPPQRNPEALSSATSQDRSSLRRRKRTSPVRNRMREFRSSGSVRGGDGNVPTYSAAPCCRSNATFGMSPILLASAMAATLKGRRASSPRLTKGLT